MHSIACGERMLSKHATTSSQGHFTLWLRSRVSRIGAA